MSKFTQYKDTAVLDALHKTHTVFTGSNWNVCVNVGMNTVIVLNFILSLTLQILYVHGKDYKTRATTISEEYPMWVWARLKGPLILLIIDSLVLLAALIRMGCILRKNQGLRINLWFMALHYSILTISIGTLFVAYDSKNLVADEPEAHVSTFNSLFLTFSLYMAFKFVMNASITFILFQIAKKQKDLNDIDTEKPAQVTDEDSALSSTRASKEYAEHTNSTV